MMDFMEVFPAPLRPIRSTFLWTMDEGAPAEDEEEEDEDEEDMLVVVQTNEQARKGQGRRRCPCLSVVLCCVCLSRVFVWDEGKTEKEDRGCKEGRKFGVLLLAALVL